MTRPQTSTVIGLGFVLCCVAAIYGLGLNNAPVFDDDRLADGTIYGVYGSLLKLQPRMLSYGSFVWVDQLFGHHLALQRVVNVLLHLCTCGAIWLLTRELFAGLDDPACADTPADPALARQRAWAIAAGVALYAVHPVAVYAVGYLIQRSIVMTTLFGALACLSYVRALRRRSLAWGALALACVALALAAKEHAVTLPLLALPLYVYVRRPSARQLAGPVLLALALAAVLTAALWSRFGAMVGAAAFDETSGAYLRQLEQARPGISAHVYGLSLLNQAAQFWHYGVLWWLPNVQWMAIDLRPPFPVGFGAMPQLLLAIGFVGLLLGAAALLWRGRASWRLAGLAVLCPMLLFGTEFVTTWLQDPFVLYRSYWWAMWLPTLFALVLLVFPPRAMLTLAGVLVVVFSALAAERVLSLRDAETAWGDAAEKVDLQAPFNAFGRWRPFVNRGTHRLERQLDQMALADFDTAVALQEPLGSAQMNRGMALHLLNRPAEALAAFEAARKQGFDRPALPFQQAESHKALQQFEPAYQRYAQALAHPKLAPEVRRQALLGQAEVAVPAGHPEVAVANYQKLLELEPGNPRYQVGLGIAYLSQKDLARAMAEFDRSLAQKPTAPAHYGKALVYRAQGQLDAAIAQLAQAAQLAPGNRMYGALARQLNAARQTQTQGQGQP